MAKVRRCLVVVVLLWSCGTSGGEETDVAGSGADTADLAAAEVATEVSPEETADSAPWPYEFEPVVFAIVSDIHIDGPFESSIPQKVVALLQTAAAVEPSPEFIAITGDLTDQMPEPVETGDGSILDSLQKVLAACPVPVEAVLGNHDYYKMGEAVFAWTPDPVLRTQVFEEAIGIPPWRVEVHGGAKFIYINSLYGPVAEDSLGLNGSMGAEQIAWLEEELSDGVPALLFLHHPPAIVLEEEGVRTLYEIIEDHAASILAVFVGHIHVFATETINGVPVYITSAGFYGKAFHHVRVDPAAGTVEILNSGSIDYGETEVVPCAPQREPGLSDLDALADQALVIEMPDGHIDPMGLGTYLRELVAEIPLAVQLGAATAPDSLEAYVTVGKRVGDPADGLPAHIAPVSDGSCAPVALTLDGPCFESTPATVTIDLGKVLGFPLPPGWYLRAELTELALSGVLLDGPVVEQGVLRATIDFNLGNQDLQNIIVMQYCNGKMTGCQPGEGDLPPCPDEAGPEFFEAIPEHCDFELLGIGLRTIFTIFASVPGLAVDLDANFTIFPAAESEEAEPGTVAPDLFAGCTPE